MRFGPPVSVTNTVEEKGRGSNSKRPSKQTEDRAITPNADEKTLKSPKNNPLLFSSTLAQEGRTSYRKIIEPPSSMITLSTLPADQYPDDTATTVGSSRLAWSPQTENATLHGDREAAFTVRSPLFSTRTPQPRRPQSTDRQRSPSPPAARYATPEGPRTPEDEVFSEIKTVTDVQTAVGPSLGTTPQPSACFTPFEEVTPFSFYARSETTQTLESASESSCFVRLVS
jgi:hypothetical protein